MSYNPYSAINAIYNLKGQWNKANTDNDTATKNDVAAKAQSYYKQLRDNGYSSVADELTAADINSAKTINNYYAKTGRTETRPYLYTLGKQYGLSQNEMDNIIGWDSSTGEVSIGGKKVGKPDAVVEGTSYWGDTTVLDNAFNDYISRSGTTRSKSTAVNQENENLFKKYNQEYEDLKGTNPFETDEAKSILAKYDLAGLRGRDNAVASNAGSNGGNIDSFAAANALRQQSSMINQGQQIVLEAYQQKLDHAKSLLSDMGVNIDRVYNQDETSKNNDVARKSEVASVTGYTPTEWNIQNDDFLKNFVDESGKLKPEYNDTDFQALINNAKSNGNTELANKYAILRGLKIFGNFSEYGNYLQQGDVSYIQPQRTAEYDLTKQQIESAERIANGENAASIAIADKEAASAKAQAQIKAQSSSGTKPTLTASQVMNAVKNGETSQSVIDAYNYYFGTNYTVDNPPIVDNESTSNDFLLPDTTGTNNGTTEQENSVFSKWEKDGITFDTVKITAVDADKIKSCGVDKHGEKAITNAISAVTNGNLGVNGIVSNYDLADYLIKQSDANDTNKSQLGKIFAYFGLDKKMLDSVGDSGFWFWEWGKGTRYK